MTSQTNFRYQPYVTVSGNLGSKIPFVDDVLSSHEQQIYPTTSLDENSIEFRLQTDRNYYIDLRQSYLALKIKLVKGRGYNTHKSKEAEKEHKDEEQPTEAAANDEEDDTNSLPFLTYVNIMMHSFFSNVEVYIISKYTTQMDSMLTSRIFPTILRERTSELQYPNMKVTIRLIRARPIFYMISDNPNVSLGIVDCSR